MWYHYLVGDAFCGVKRSRFISLKLDIRIFLDSVKRISVGICWNTGICSQGSLLDTKNKNVCIKSVFFTARFCCFWYPLTVWCKTSKLFMEESDPLLCLKSFFTSTESPQCVCSKSDMCVSRFPDVLSSLSSPSSVKSSPTSLNKSPLDYWQVANTEQQCAKNVMSPLGSHGTKAWDLEAVRSWQEKTEVSLMMQGVKTQSRGVGGILHWRTNTSTERIKFHCSIIPQWGASTCGWKKAPFFYDTALPYPPTSPEDEWHGWDQLWLWTRIIHEVVSIRTLIKVYFLFYFLCKWL